MTSPARLGQLPQVPGPPLRESTAGAWLGLLLIAYGAASMCTAGFIAGSAHLSRRIFEFALVQLEVQREEGAGTQTVHDMTSEVSAQVSGLEPALLLHAGISLALGLLLLIGAFGICRRSALFRRIAQAAVLAKAALFGVSAWSLHVTYVPGLRKLASSLEELLDLVERATAQSGATSRGDPFAAFRAFANGGLDTAAVWLTVLFSLPILLALWIVFSRSVRLWCTAEPERD